MADLPTLLCFVAPCLEDDVDNVHQKFKTPLLCSPWVLECPYDIFYPALMHLKTRQEPSVVMRQNTYGSIRRKNSPVWRLGLNEEELGIATAM